MHGLISRSLASYQGKFGLVSDLCFS